MSNTMWVKRGQREKPEQVEQSLGLRLIGQGKAVAVDAPKGKPTQAKAPDSPKPARDVMADGA
jgi:hypothetical protein